MAQLIWTEPALSDLDAVADYIALDKPKAARDYVQLVFQRIEQLVTQPESGSTPKELRGSRYRQIVVPPCRIFYRFDGRRIYILHVMRGEMLFKKSRLVKRDEENRPTYAAPNGSPRGSFRKRGHNFTGSVTDAAYAASAPSPRTVLLPSAALREPWVSLAFDNNEDHTLFFRVHLLGFGWMFFDLIQSFFNRSAKIDWC